jgi:hypothetical protein
MDSQRFAVQTVPHCAGQPSTARFCDWSKWRILHDAPPRIQRPERRARHEDNGHRSEALRRSPYKRMVRERSLYTSASLHPGRSAALAPGAATSGVLAWKRRH